MKISLYNKSVLDRVNLQQWEIRKRERFILHKQILYKNLVLRKSFILLVKTKKKV